jgi:hypothetical protein
LFHAKKKDGYSSYDKQVVIDSMKMEMVKQKVVDSMKVEMAKQEA